MGKKAENLRLKSTVVICQNGRDVKPQMYVSETIRSQKLSVYKPLGQFAIVLGGENTLYHPLLNVHKKCTDIYENGAHKY